MFGAIGQFGYLSREIWVCNCQFHMLGHRTNCQWKLDIHDVTTDLSSTVNLMGKRFEFRNIPICLDVVGDTMAPGEKVQVL